MKEFSPGDFTNPTVNGKPVGGKNDHQPSPEFDDAVKVITTTRNALRKSIQGLKGAIADAERNQPSFPSPVDPSPQDNRRLIIAAGKAALPKVTEIADALDRMIDAAKIPPMLYEYAFDLWEKVDRGIHAAIGDAEGIITKSPQSRVKVEDWHGVAAQRYWTQIATQEPPLKYMKEIAKAVSPAMTAVAGAGEVLYVGVAGNIGDLASSVSDIVGAVGNIADKDVFGAAQNGLNFVNDVWDSIWGIKGAFTVFSATKLNQTIDLESALNDRGYYIPTYPNWPMPTLDFSRLLATSSGITF